MDSAFHAAIAAVLMGDHDSLRQVLHDNVGLVRLRSSCGHPTLLQMVACEARNLRNPVGAAAVLVEAGAELSEPLVAAASVDARDVLLFLLDHGVAVDGEAAWTPLDEALYWRHLQLGSILRQRGATVGSLRAAAGLGDVDVLDGFFQASGLRPDAGPIGSPFADTVPAPPHAGQDIIDNAFVLAVQNGHRGCAERLLSRGAVVDAKPPGYHWRGTALHGAVWHGDAVMVEWLLGLGADPTVRDDHVGSDAVGWAQHHRHEAIAALLSSR
jgi:hypothetical protein